MHWSRWLPKDRPSDTWGGSTSRPEAGLPTAGLCGAHSLLTLLGGDLRSQRPPIGLKPKSLRKGQLGDPGGSGPPMDSMEESLPPSSLSRLLPLPCAALLHPRLFLRVNGGPLWAYPGPLGGRGPAPGPRSRPPGRGLVQSAWDPCRPAAGSEGLPPSLCTVPSAAAPAAALSKNRTKVSRGQGGVVSSCEHGGDANTGSPRPPGGAVHWLPEPQRRPLLQAPGHRTPPAPEPAPPSAPRSRASSAAGSPGGGADAAGAARGARGRDAGPRR